MITDARDYTKLTRDEVAALLSPGSILCLPVGSTEQHGPHLPVGTDSVLADKFTDRLIATYRDRYDIWRLPCLEFGLSREHTGGAGTVSLDVVSYASAVRALVVALAEGQPARNLVLVNGHGGNRGVLETLILEFRREHALAAVVLHPTALSTVKSGSRLPEVHAGKSETSVMLELAPELVSLSRLPVPQQAGDQPAVRKRILDRGVSWPWNSGDPGLNNDGVIGDAAAASAELGREIVGSALANAGTVLHELVAFGEQLRFAE